MQNNKILKEFLEHEYNQDANYKAIVAKTERKLNMKKKILNVAAVVLVIITVGIITPTVYAKIAWNIEFKEYQKREKVSGWGTVNEAIKDGYEENINMEYIYKDGIGIKIDSLMLTDDYFKMQVNMKFDENAKINTETFSYGVAIYDESNNVYAIAERVHWGTNEKASTYFKKFYKETGIKYNKKNVFANELATSCSKGIVSAIPGNIITDIEMSSYKGFPKSKKIYVRIFDIGYSMYERDIENKKIKNGEDFPLTDVEWNIEIDVPEKFYEREITELKLFENIEDIRLTKAEISETGLVINADITGLVELIMSGKDMNVQEFNNLKDNTIFVSDENGEKYLPLDMGTISESEMFMKFDLGKKDLTKKLYLNININEQSYKIELVKK